MRNLVALFLTAGALLPAEPGYRPAPAQVRAILDAPAPPQISINPTRSHALLLQSRRYPPIAELAQPMLRLAGLRINPANNAPHRGTSFYSISLVRLDTGASTALRLPNSPRLSTPRWSPDGASFAFLNTTDTTVELWVGRAATGELRRMDGLRIHSAIGEPFQWLPGSRSLLVQLVPGGRPAPPEESKVPAGPTIQETAGKAGPARTYQDLLASPHDERLFEYYATSQLAIVPAAAGAARSIGKPAIYISTDPAPDGKHLLVSHVHRPFTYLHSYSSFPREVEVWDTSGVVVGKIASLPLRDRVPIDGVPTGPRNHHWHPIEPATLIWTEALDGGNPKEKVPHRDRIVTQAYPFTSEALELHRTEHRLNSIRWLERGSAIVTDLDRNRRWTRVVMVSSKGSMPKQLFSRNVQDRYGDPGTPIYKTTSAGQRVILQSGDSIYLEGNGASPSGDRPFLDRYDLNTGKAERVFHCEENSYESPVDVLDAGASRILTRRETPTEPPNFFIRAAGAQPRALTQVKDPAPELRRITKQLVTYKRADGVPLSFTLYLPPDYKPGTPLPTVVWAYPREFNDAETAGQISGSTQRFTTLSGASHLFFLLNGYAILDGAAMPVVGDPETVNNTYIEQVVASAKAAIDKAAEMGVTDRKRVGVGGHSYGAFMTANLLAHSDLFRAGIARSGAYNRTLTPFGFQSERRTIWEAPETYLKMSPFLYANKINEPILFIHGEADNNAGTFPIQSDRMYQAVRGNGGTARFVLLPHESHGYEGRESVEHTLAEMIGWFDKHVKEPSN
jgi:dipeptidyl aminopeptidase/acylaminoacyl peptidase